MSSLFKSISDLIKGTEDYPLGWDLKKIDRPNPTYWAETHTCDFLTVYQRIRGENPSHMITFSISEASSGNPIIYSIARFPTPAEAHSFAKAFERQLPVIISNAKNISKESNLRTLVEKVKDHPHYNSAHIAVTLGNDSWLRQTWLPIELFNEGDDNGQLPLHLACSEGKLDCIRELTLHTTFETADSYGNTSLHYSTRNDANLEVTKMIITKCPALLNRLNVRKMSPIHICCQNDAHKTLKWLIDKGAKLGLKCDKGYPLHVAMEFDSTQCVEILCVLAPEQINILVADDGKQALHMAKSKEVMTALLEHGCSPEARNKRGETPLHLMVEKRLLGCVIRLLSHEADPSAQDEEGNTPLHRVVKVHTGWFARTADTICLHIVRALIVFGCDVNVKNNAGESARHMIARTKDAKLLFTVSAVGAQRCSRDMKDCTEGCSADGEYEGEEISPSWEKPNLSNLLEEMMEGFKLAIASQQRDSSTKYDTILNMDGGGIRGLVLLLTLRALEKAIGKPLKDSFTYFAGTSTGGIIALGLALGFSVSKAMGLYFRFKDEVFQGIMRPYDTKPLEILLKEYFTEDKVMTSITSPKLFVTSVIGDRTPPDIFFFTNFEYPPNSSQQRNKDLTHNGRFKEVLLPEDQKIWEAARSTSAAPTFFAPHGPMLDGGLMSNNPTLDVMTEVFHINQSKKKQGLPETRIGAIISVGTGMVPCIPVSLSVSKPSGIFDSIRSINGLINLGSVIIDQATVSEGRPVDYAKAWCRMSDIPYVRLNPPISQDIPLNETQDSVLLRTMWEAQCFITQNSKLFEQTAQLINELNSSRTVLNC